MGQIEIEVTDVLKMVKQLAADHYGDSDEAAMGQVVQAALEMRLRWFRCSWDGGLSPNPPKDTDGDSPKPYAGVAMRGMARGYAAGD